MYAYGLVLLQITGLLFSLRKIDVAELVDYAVTIVGMIGLFGYAYRRTLWRRRIWMAWSAFLPAWDVVFGLWVYPRQNGTGIRIGYFVGMLLILPNYLALIRYAYGSRDLWSEAAG